MKGRVLLCVPQEELKEEVKKNLKSWGFYAQSVDDGAACIGELERGTPEIVLCSSRVPLVSAKGIFERVQKNFPFVPFILALDNGEAWQGVFCWKVKEGMEQLKKVLFEALRSIRGKVLVIDDHDEFRSTVASILREAEFDVTEASDGKEGVEKAAREDYDVVLTDIHMPRLNGCEAAKRIHRMRPAAYIVCMTGEADEEEVRKALKAAKGHYACLRKPFDYQAFLIVMRNLRQEAAQYRALAERHLFQRALDSLKHGWGAALHRWLEVKSAFTVWTVVILLALGIGFAASWATIVLPELVTKFIAEQRKEIRKEMERSIFEKEIQKRKEELSR